MKDESYRALQQKEVQLSAARDNAYKYTMNSLQNQGYANQGLAQSTVAGIGNQYLSAMGAARAQNASDVNAINMQQAQDEQAKVDNDLTSLTTYMSENYNGDKNAYIEAMRKTEGADAVDDEGYFTQKYLDQYSPEQQKNLLRANQTLFNTNTLEYGKSGAILNDYNGSNTASIGFSNGDIMNKNVIDQNGEVGKFKDEINFITASQEKNNSLSKVLNNNGLEITNGTVVFVAANKDANASFAYVIYKDGRWYQTNQTVFNNAQNAYSVYSDKNSATNFNVITKNGQKLNKK